MIFVKYSNAVYDKFTQAMHIMISFLLCLQQAAGNFYDLSAYSGVPSTIATGREQTAGLPAAPFTGIIFYV